MMILLQPWHAHNCFFVIKTTLFNVSWSSTQAHALHFTTMVTPQNTNCHGAHTREEQEHADEDINSNDNI